MNTITNSLIFMTTAVSGALIQPSIWPMPKTVTYEEGSYSISNKISYEVYTNDNTNTIEIPTLTKAFTRYHDLIFQHTIRTSDVDTTSDTTTTKKKQCSFDHVSVKVQDASEVYPQLDTDESYSIDFNMNLKQCDITITSETIYGALRGLESFSQLIFFDYNSHEYFITPATVQDTPRYAHRGLLLDTSRHYQSVSNIKHTLDALSYSKYNVLHWHVVDSQSFPFESKTYPKLWDGAFTTQEKYTQEDMAELVEYGRERGIKIMIEFDMPGHAGSWCEGYPDICPSTTCTQPLNPASNSTFPLISSLLNECTASQPGKGLFPYEFLHLGGDEVSYACWEVSTEIQSWEVDMGFKGSEDVYEYFVDMTANITRSQSRTPVQWVEVYEHFGSKLDENTVVHVWKEKETLNDIVNDGYRTILSNQGEWYLDHLDTTWEEMYINEPTDGLTDMGHAGLIIGGESCMWGETVDDSDLDNTVWPRAAAVGERLWTDYDTITTSEYTTDLEVVQDRLESFRCLLASRGVNAAPVTNRKGRDAPPGPGSCYSQRR